MTTNTTETELMALLEAAADVLRAEGHPDAETILAGADPRAMLDAAAAVHETIDAIDALRRRST